MNKRVKGLSDNEVAVRHIKPELRTLKGRKYITVFKYEAVIVRDQLTGVVHERLIQFEAIRRYTYNRSKYRPHQGSQECARRRAQA